MKDHDHERRSKMRIKKKGIAVKYTDVSEYLLPYNERPSTIEKEARKAAAAAE